VDIPNEGRLIVSSNAYQISPTTWRYEYLVYNLNSDRMVGSFAVPVGSSTTESNVGFRDVAYRDGDGPGNVNLDGTDWVGTKSSGVLTWAAQPCTRNITTAVLPGTPIGVYDCTNAIRFGTAYNFRFDMAAVPTTGIVTLGLHKAGTPASVTAAAKVPTIAIPCPLDVTGNGVVDADDIFAFISIWFTANPGSTCSGCQADWDGNGTVDADDIFAYLDDWFAFGPGNACP
jgi:hypothetical protein